MVAKEETVLLDVDAAGCGRDSMGIGGGADGGNDKWGETVFDSGEVSRSESDEIEEIELLRFGFIASYLWFAVGLLFDVNLDGSRRFWYIVFCADDDEDTF